MSDEKDIYDLTIIGGGPVGLFALLLKPVS